MPRRAFDTKCAQQANFGPFVTQTRNSKILKMLFEMLIIIYSEIYYALISYTIILH